MNVNVNSANVKALVPNVGVKYPSLVMGPFDLGNELFFSVSHAVSAEENPDSRNCKNRPINRRIS